MRNKWTRVGKALLCLTLAASMLAGCGGGGGSSSSSGAAESSGSGEASTSSAASTPDENFNETGLPIVNEQVELTFLYVKGANLADFEENAMFQQMEKDTNVKINWQYAGDADWSEQKSLLLASGDLPDVFFGSNSLKDMDIATNLELFIPLEDYVEKYCPNIQAAWEAEPTMEKMVTNPDGHIYTLPGKKPLRPKGCDTPFINQKWLDNLGLEMPTTVDEWYEVLKAFKEKDPNGNGVADEIPLTGSAKQNLFDWIRYINPWGITDSLEENYLALDQETEKPVFIPADERYKEAVAFFHKLYAEGIMDPEFITQDGSMSGAKMKNEEVALVGTGITWEVTSGTQPHQDEYVPMPPLAGPNGDRYIRGNDQTITYSRNEFTITTACEHPEVAMRWADHFATDDISVQSYWGPYGVVLEKQDDGTITFLDPPEGKTGDQWYWEISPRDHGPKYVSPEFEEKIILPEDSGDGAKLKEDEIMKEFVAKPYPLVNYTSEQAEEISSLTVDIYKYVNESWANWIVNGGIEEQWDAYVDQLNKMGLERLMEIYQEALDVYNNAG